jgi:hypothetical protein
MNSKQFNQFKSYVNQPGSSAGGRGLLPILMGLGLIWLAKSSIYYGKTLVIFKSTLAITQLSSTSYGADWHPTDTSKATTLGSPSLKSPSFTTSKPEKTKSEPKLPTETCSWSSSQSRSCSIPKLIICTQFT